MLGCLHGGPRAALCRCVLSCKQVGGPGRRALTMQGRCGGACAVPRGYRSGGRGRMAVSKPAPFSVSPPLLAPLPSSLSPSLLKHKGIPSPTSKGGIPGCRVDMNSTPKYFEFQLRTTLKLLSKKGFQKIQKTVELEKLPSVGTDRNKEKFMDG